MKSIDSAKITPFLFGMLSPFLLLVNSFRISGKHRQWFLITFITFYGATAVFPEYADATRHLQSINDLYLDISLSEFLEVSGQILSFNPPAGYQDDIFIHTLSFLCGFLGWPRLLYIIVSWLYGYLFVKSLTTVFRSLRLKEGGALLLFTVVLLFFWKNIEGINSIRNHTGAWYLFYVTMRYLETKKKKYFTAIFLSPLIHFQYLLIFPLVILGLKIKLSTKLLVTIFIISFLVNVPTSTFTSRVQTTELGASKVKAYVKDQDYIDRKNKLKFENSHIYTKVATDGSMYNVMAVLAFILLTYNGINRFEYIRRIMTIGVLLCTMANLFEPIVSIYSRVYQNGGLYILSGLVMIQREPEIISRSRGLRWMHNVVIVLLSLPSSLFVFFKLSQLAGYISVFIFSSPFLSFINEKSNISIKEILNFLI